MTLEEMKKRVSDIEMAQHEIGFLQGVLSGEIHTIKIRYVIPKTEDKNDEYWVMSSNATFSEMRDALQNMMVLRISDLQDEIAKLLTT